MPAIFHVKIEDDTFDGAVNHIVEATDDDTVWHCEEAGDGFDGAIFHVKWAEDGHEEPVWRVSGISRGTVTTVGPAVSPLSLTDAIANSLQYVKAYGGTELTGTPTPSTPATITCNNGILKVKDSELPVGYKRLTGITYDSNTYYETNEKLYGSDTLTLRLSNTKTAGQNIIGAYSGTSSYSRNFSLYIYGNGSTSTSYLRHGTKLGKPRYGTGARTLVMGPSGTDGFLTDVTYDAEDFETTDTFWIGSLPNSTSTKYDGNIIGNITVSNRLKYIPCERVSDGVIGYYETFTDTFLENQGNGTPVSMGYEVSYMTEVYVDGTVETVTTKQAFINDSDVVDRTGLNSSNGSAISNNNRCYVLFPCKAGVTYTAQTDTADLIGGNFIEYNQPVAASANFIKSLTVTDDGLVGGVYKSHVVCDADGWAGWQCKSNKATAMANNWQITSDISSATCEPLLAVGDYTDVQSILDGVVTRNVGVKVLTGEEDWNLAGSGDALRVDIRTDIGLPPTQDLTSPMICTHYPFDAYFSGGGATQPGTFNAWNGQEGYFLRFSIVGMNITTVAQWKDWLAAQAEAGTPVIIVYPLATPTTEAAETQTLQVEAGDNTIEITQASILDLEIEARYMKGVVASVEEVDSQGLDNNVSVSLS